MYSASHEVIRFFWEVMATFTPEQKRNFLRYAWGRSRLPRGRWPTNYRGQQVKFKIVPQNRDSGLPLAHTCFFTIELPKYKTKEALARSLMTAIEYGAGEGFAIA